MEVDANGRIAAIGRDGLNGSGADSTLAAIGKEHEMFDARGAMVVPGFIDVHVHGGGGYDAMSGEPEQLAGMCRYHAAHGTTSLLATTMTAPEGDIVHALQGIARTMKAAAEQPAAAAGADLLGAHLEGPFLNEVRCGAQNPANLRLPSLSEWQRYEEAGEGCIRLLTIAPELQGAEEVVKAAAAAGVTVSVGHSDADYDQVRAAVGWGCSHVTHLFNGMRPLLHRDPGVAGGALMLDELAVELIADGIHVHPDLVSWVFRAKPDGKVMLITDCIAAGGCSDGDYELGGLPVRLEGGRIYIRAEGGSRGSLAGSALTTLAALLGAARFAGKRPEELLSALTTAPARQIGLERCKGSLEVGKDADFLVLSEDWQLERTYVRGRQVYERASGGTVN
jgi:N-acetylglucosamine-6-phosphate deacetylase